MALLVFILFFPCIRCKKKKKNKLSLLNMIWVEVEGLDHGKKILCWKGNWELKAYWKLIVTTLKALVMDHCFCFYWFGHMFYLSDEFTLVMNVLFSKLLLADRQPPSSAGPDGAWPLGWWHEEHTGGPQRFHPGGLMISQAVQLQWRKHFLWDATTHPKKALTATQIRRAITRGEFVWTRHCSCQ